MPRVCIVIAALFVVALTGCGKSDDAVGEKMVQSADAQADQMDKKAEELDQQADEIRDNADLKRDWAKDKQDVMESAKDKGITTDENVMKQM